MILRLLSLGTGLTPEVRESQSAIESAFKHILDEEHTFKNFENENDFLAELSDAIATDHMIVLACEPALYPAFKTFVCKSFKLKCRPNKVILKRIGEKHPELDEEIVSAQALIPLTATPLLSQDGIYSGFAVKAKKQLLIVMALDDKRIDHVINRGLQPYVRANMDMSALIADPLQDVEQEKAAVKVTEEKKPSGALYDVKLIRNTVKNLSSKGLSVAVANTKTVDFLGNISTTSVDLSKTVFVSPYFSEKGELSGREYAVDLAKGALLNSSNSVGAAITKVFSAPLDDGSVQLFMYVCIADKENANVAKLTAEPGETPPQLIYKAIEELFKMLNLWSDTGYAMPQFTDESIVRENKAAKESDDKNKKICIITSSILALSSIISLIISFTLTDIYGVMPI